MSATLKDLAEAAGLSIRSVRRALEKQPGVSLATRKKILLLARELGYVPNIAARNLRTGATVFVGLLSAAAESDVSRRRTLDLIDRLEQRGLHSLAARMPTTPMELRDLTRNWSGLVRTLIFMSPPNADVEKTMDSLPVRCLVIDGTRAAANLIPLRIERAPGIRAAIHHLIAGGRKHILRCGLFPNRTQGFESAFADHPEIRHAFFPVAESSFRAGWLAAPELLKRQADAVFFDVDPMAFGFLRYAWEHGVRVPESVAVVGFDDERAGLFSCPALATVAQPIDELNEAILDLVLHPDLKTQLKSFPTYFIPRESAGGGEA